MSKLESNKSEDHGFNFKSPELYQFRGFRQFTQEQMDQEVKATIQIERSKHKIRIFAKRNTSEKVLVRCSFEETPQMMTNLSEKFGGDWVYIQELDPGQMLFFDDGILYFGYNPKNPDHVYVKQIEKRP